MVLVRSLDHISESLERNSKVIYPINLIEKVKARKS